MKQLTFTLFGLIAGIALLTSCSVPRRLSEKNDAIYNEYHPKLGGYLQSVIVRGQNKNNPVLIHLHGGPGYPLFPYLDNNQELERYFTVVYWEQRGTASSLNYKLNKVSMQTDTLLNDLNDLVNWVQATLDTNKVYLWGHSWGTNLGMLYVSQHPEKVKAYIGTGQSVNLFENERMAYRFVLDSARFNQNKKALRHLLSIDTLDYNLDDALEVRKWIYNYGGIVHAGYTEKPYINFDIVKDVFKTPEYTVADKWRLMLRSKYSGKTLWDDMMKIDLFRQVPKVDVPVYFFEGRYDHIVSCQLAEKYFNFLDAPKGKTLIWFEQSAHRPEIEEPAKFISEMIKVLQNEQHQNN